MEAQEYLSRLNEILLKKQAMLNEFMSFTRMQKESLSKEDFDELEILIAKKQSRMDAVDKLDEQFAVYSEGLKKTLDIQSFDELPSKRIPGTRELKDNTARVLDLLNEIKQIDDENTAFMKSKMAKVKDKIKQSNGFKKVSAAYFHPRQGLINPYFDKKK